MPTDQAIILTQFSPSIVVLTSLIRPYVCDGDVAVDRRQC